MTIDNSNNHVIHYPRQDVVVAQGHVNRLKGQYSTNISLPEPSSQELMIFKGNQKVVDYTGLKRGTVRHIAGIWGGISPSQPETKKDTASKVNIEHSQLNSGQRKRSTRKSTYKIKKSATDQNVPKRYGKSRFKRKHRAKTAIQKHNNTSKEESQSMRIKLKDSCIPHLKVPLSLEECKELETASENLNVFYEVYKTCFWPPKAKGIFRVASSMKLLNELDCLIGNTSVDSLKSVLRSKIQNDDGLTEHLLVGIIKKTFRDLSTPAIPLEFYESFMSVSRINGKQQIQLLEELVQQLPPVHQKLIARLMTFLKDLAEYKKVTSMDVNNLAIVMAPNILIPPDGLPLTQLLQDANYSTQIVTVMIDYAKVLFES